MRQYVLDKKVGESDDMRQNRVYSTRNGNFNAKYDKNSNYFKFDSFSSVQLFEKFYFLKLMLGNHTDISPILDILQHVMHFENIGYNSNETRFKTEKKKTYK